MADETKNPSGGSLDRRGFLKCMAWAGSGLLCTVSGGVLSSCTLAEAAERPAEGELSFVQISDSHIGFAKGANPDVVGTLREAVKRINALPRRPAFILHTGDLTHLSREAEFDTLAEVLKEARAGDTFQVPGEHDLLDPGGRAYLARYGEGTAGSGWYSFDQKGVHFIGLVNVVGLKPEGLGVLGAEQLAWLREDVRRLPDSTPVVVFAHVPLWAVYPQWGWGTQDGAEALSYLRRFGSVTVLNGHIHQTMQKVEGTVTFHTAASTAFPQAAPGTGGGPGPMTVEPGRLRELLGVTAVRRAQGQGSLAIIDRTLADG